MVSGQLHGASFHLAVPVRQVPESKHIQDIRDLAVFVGSKLYLDITGLRLGPASYSSRGFGKNVILLGCHCLSHSVVLYSYIEF